MKPSASLKINTQGASLAARVRKTFGGITMNAGVEVQTTWGGKNNTVAGIEFSKLL